MKVKIEEIHELEQSEAKMRVDRFVEFLSNMPLPGGIVASNKTRTWHNNTLSFSFDLGFGMFKGQVSGMVHVTLGRVILELDVPGMLAMVVPEAKLRERVSRELKSLLTRSPMDTI